MKPVHKKVLEKLIDELKQCIENSDRMVELLQSEFDKFNRREANNTYVVREYLRYRNDSARYKLEVEAIENLMEGHV
jgi:vacuolar-type H+-ATPase subunit I/STV1